MELQFNVTGQKIVRSDSNEIVSDTVNYIKAVFTFSEEWEGFQKTALFKQGKNAYQVLLVNDTCVIPHEVLITGKTFVSVFGLKGDIRITATTSNFSIIESGYCEGDIPDAPSPSIYEQIMELISSGGIGGGREEVVHFDIVDGYLVAIYDDGEEDENGTND